jgi:hypothetical protein
MDAAGMRKRGKRLDVLLAGLGVERHRAIEAVRLDPDPGGLTRQEWYAYGLALRKALDGMAHARMLLLLAADRLEGKTAKEDR